MRLYLIRHGQSTNNALGDDPSKRVYDPHLTDLGREQAQHVADYLAKQPEDVQGNPYRITHLYSSAMHRALETVQPIAAALDLKAHIWIDVHERGGLFEEREGGQFIGFPGLTRRDILEKFPQTHLSEGDMENGWWNPEHGLEDVISSQYRAMKVASALFDRIDSDDGIAIVTHGGFLDLLIKALFRQLPTKPHILNYFSYNTAITRIAFYDGEAVLHYLNRVEHLPEDMWSS